MASVASDATDDADGDAFSALPQALLLRVFACLPVDALLRCAEVSRIWAQAVAEHSLWARVDVTAESGGMRRPATDALLRAAARRAGSHLHALDVSRCEHVTRTALQAVVTTASGGALRELRACTRDDGELLLRVEHVRALLAAAPGLRALHASVFASAANAAALLRNEAPFQPLRLHWLRVRLPDDDPQAVLSLAADVAHHASPLAQLTLSDAPLGEAALLDAVVDAALASGLQALDLDECRVVAHEASPALARLLRGTALRELRICEGFLRRPLLSDAASSAQLADALRANATLTRLALVNVDLFRTHAAALPLLAACASHASLAALDVSHNHVPIDVRAEVGQALGALLAADAPALRSLDVTECWLGAPGLQALLDGLAHNASLTALRCADNRMSEAFAAEVLLPALRAHAALHTLAAASSDWEAEGHEPAKRAAEALVASRRSCSG
jgi:hypothetical protein